MHKDIIDFSSVKNVYLEKYFTWKEDGFDLIVIKDIGAQITT